MTVSRDLLRIFEFHSLLVWYAFRSVLYVFPGLAAEEASHSFKCLRQSQQFLTSLRDNI